MVPYKRLWACPIHETLKCKAGAKIRNLYYKKCYCESWQLSLEKAVRSYVQRNVTTSPTQQTSLVASLKGFHNTGQLKLQIYHFDKKEWVFTWYCGNTHQLDQTSASVWVYATGGLDAGKKNRWQCAAFCMSSSCQHSADRTKQWERLTGCSTSTKYHFGAT